MDAVKVRYTVQVVVVNTIMIITLFNKELAIKENYCSFLYYNPVKITTPYINLYVKLSNVCNAKCNFCEFNGPDKNSFDIYKFYFVINEINKNIKINKISFTGGEPTLQLPNLKNCLKIIKDINNDIFTIINTNGIHLKELDNIPDLVNSIALSRHHYDDDLNYEIFKTKTIPSNNDINNFKNKNLLHLSCNLIKNYIDTNSKCYDYINFYSKMNILDFGFVSLMHVNDFCKNNHINFKDLNLQNNDNVYLNKTWNNEKSCSCNNFLVSNEEGIISKVYARYYSNRSPTCDNTLVYDNGVLTQGFGGQIIFS